MLDDREQRVLDATAVQLGHEEPELAALLRDHAVPDPARPSRTSRPSQRARRRVPVAVWPPVIMVLVCLVLLVVPMLLR